MKSQTTVLLADDHRLFREGTAALLARVDSISLVGEASDGESVAALSAQLQPDVVLLDVEMPGPTAATTISRIHRTSPTTSVVVLTMHRNRLLEHRLVTAGAHSYVNKAVSIEELVHAISMAKTSREGNRPRHASTLSPSLTPREIDVLFHLVLPSTNAEIAQALHVTVGTVKRHVYNIYKKLGVSSRAEAIQFASLLDRSYGQ